MDIKIDWDTLATLPCLNGMIPHPGLAGILSGAQNKALIIAGGSNFKNKPPWEGGQKLYYDDIFILRKGINEKLEWFSPREKLPEPLAYSACVSTPEGLICLGGENLSGVKKVALSLILSENKLHVNKLPDLPIALSNSGAGVINETIYLAGGADSSGVARSCFFSLNFSADNADWKTLPDLPEPLSHALVVSQSDGNEKCIYVIGGRYKRGLTSTFSTNIWKFSPSINNWRKEGILVINGQNPFGISAGPGISLGNHNILLLGGDKGDLFNKTEKYNNAIEKAEDKEEYKLLTVLKKIHLIKHPGFCRDIYLFDTVTKSLSFLKKLPGMAQVTTSAFWWDDQIIIPLGEIKPGIRTPVIKRGQVFMPNNK